MNIALGCDDAAVEFLNILKEHLISLGYECTDYSEAPKGEENYYADVAQRVATAVSENKHERGLIVCGTGIGVSIMANKIPGIRAALCHDVFSAIRARKSNGAQIITMGSRVIGPELAKTILSHWMEADTIDESSLPKVERINQLESAIQTS
ncbi:RpiB/LacA/LacB family sugar-phosphate isomerase [Vibrio sp. qd031]|uniref:RpiB/LacA/LacB family sugar-phosphate isomerase n=1 Tax=Vibrio sp. qd031 TaxID=1603038 RepID=UPI002693A5F5